MNDNTSDTLTDQEREALARAIYEASDDYDWNGVAWEHQYGSPKQEAFRQADTVAARIAAERERADAAEAKIAAVEAVAKKWKEVRFYDVAAMQLRNSFNNDLRAALGETTQQECQ